MKKNLLMVGFASLMLVSCSNEGVVNPQEIVGSEDAPIGFSIDKKNLSRAAAANGLEAETYAFGVSAFKANAMSGITVGATGAGTVMYNYLVGYWDGKATDWEGYKPTGEPFLPASVTNGYWYYEGLGHDDSTPAAGTGYVFNTAGTKTQYVPSAATQYLKYWDLSNEYTYFFGYTPFNNVPTMGKDGNNVTMSWASVGGASGTPMYGFAKCKNSEFANNTSMVAMEFVPLMSQIRLAFYNSIPGYDVEIIDYNTANAGVVAVPANVAAGVYTAGGEYATSLSNVKVTFYDDDTTAPTVTGTSGTSTDNILFNKSDFVKANGDATTVLGNGYDNRIFSNKFNVVPSTGNCGFTINVSLKLTAKDTQEELYIYGARVFVPTTYTEWAANKLYTYVFRITTKAPGSTTGNNPEVLPTPNNDQALFPIIFDQITVAEIEEIEHKTFDINPLP